MRSRLAVVISLAAVAQVRAQIVTEMTPARIREAIASAKDLPEDPYFWRSRERGVVIQLVTPYRRVVLAARAAQRENRTLQAREATPHDARVVLIVVAQPDPSDFTSAVTDIQYAVVAVRTVAYVIQPFGIETTAHEWSNAAGVRKKGEGIIATFPLSVLAAGNEIRIVPKSGPEVVFKLDAERLAKMR